MPGLASPENDSKHLRRGSNSIPDKGSNKTGQKIGLE